MKVKAKIRATTKNLPLPPAYASLHKETEVKPDKLNEEKATQTSSREKTGDGQEEPKKRDWSKVNRGANKGDYGRPVFWNGKSYAEIAEEFGKTPEACRRQWYKASGY